MSVVLARMPASWLTTVEVISTPGRDKYGDPLPSVSHSVTGCLLSIKSNAEGQNDSDVVDVLATLALPVGTEIRSTDRVRTPDTSVVSGEWSIDGEVLRYPLGVSVALRKESHIG